MAENVARTICGGIGLEFQFRNLKSFQFKSDLLQVLWSRVWHAVEFWIQNLPRKFFNSESDTLQIYELEIWLVKILIQNLKRSKKFHSKCVFFRGKCFWILLLTKITELHFLTFSPSKISHNLIFLISSFFKICCFKKSSFQNLKLCERFISKSDTSQEFFLEDLTLLKN